MPWFALTRVQDHSLYWLFLLIPLCILGVAWGRNRLGALLGRAHRGLRELALLMGSGLLGGLVVQVLATHPQWPWRVVLILVVLGVGSFLLFLGSRVGERIERRESRPTEAERAEQRHTELLGRLAALEDKIVPGPTSFKGPQYASASVGATGAQGAFNIERNKTYPIAHAQGHASVSFEGRGAGTAAPGPQGPTGPTGPIMPPSPSGKSDADPQPDQ
jgi:membrane protein implicated in regulation of membrane protease activity